MFATTQNRGEFMRGLYSRLLGLCLTPILFSILDATLTLTGQSAEYWAGHFSQVNEASPTFHQLLAIHPVAFAVGILAWIVIYSVLILLLPETLALIVSIAVTMGHTVGSATWIVYRFQFGYQAANGLFLVAAVALGLGIQLGWKAVPRDEYHLPLSMRMRSLASLVLFAIGVYLFLWPRRA